MKRSLLLFALSLCILQVMGQTKTISGLVRDEKGNPVQSASVSVKGSQVGTITNSEGRFTLTLPSSSRTLVISSIGYGEKEVAIQGLSQFDIALEPPTGTQLQEVVVTALGITKDKRSLGYAVQNIKNEEIADKGDLNVVNVLQGKIAGVDITGGSGAAGASSNINIRGITSFTGSNQPLFVIDGIPISNDVDRSGNTLFDQQPANRALDLNVNDIESINVLKGPAASVLYGSRASAGAIIITTKKGNAGKGKVKLTYNTSYTMQHVYGLPDFQNEYGQGANGQFNAVSPFSFGPRFGSTPNLSNGLLTTTGAIIDYKAYPDNINNFYETGTIWENGLSLGSGDRKQNYNFSINNSDQKGMLPNTSLNRTNITAGFNSYLTDRLSLGASVTYTVSRQVGILQGNGANSALFQLFSVPRSYNLDFYRINYKNPDGTSNWPINTTRDNPYFAAYEDPLTSQLNRTFGNVRLGYDIASWLNVSYRMGIDAYTDRRKKIVAIGSAAAGGVGRLLEDNHFRYELNGDLIITAKKEGLFHDNLDVTLLVGQNINNRKYQNLFVQGDELGIPGFYNVSNASVFSSSGETTRNQRLLGYYAQLSLAYDNYLFLELTGRADQSSTLPKSRNTYFYPSVAASFIFTDALKINSTFLTYGKLRASVARVGRDAPPYQLDNVYSAWNFGNNVAQFVFPYAAVIGFGAASQIANQELSPEFTTSYEIGTNLTLLKNKITIDAAYFYQSSKDQIVNVGIANSTGYNTKTSNIGEMINKGVELLVTVTPVSTRDFKWDVTANFTQIRNKVVSIGNGINSFPIPGNRFTNAEGSIVEGYPYGVIVGNKWRRAPDGQFLINPATGTLLGVEAGKVIGDPNRDFIAGMTNTVRYKNLFLSFLVDYKHGGDFLSWGSAAFRSNGSLEETGVDRDKPRIFPGVIQTPDGKYVPNNIQISAQSYWNSMSSGSSAGDLAIFDATTFRVREFSLGIDITGSQLRAKFISNARLTLFGRNLFYYAPNSPIDPEVNSQGAGNFRGLELQSAANARSFGGAIRITF
jgi:TonB-linked SusC/RagA family outer membrane protein